MGAGHAHAGHAHAHGHPHAHGAAGAPLATALVVTVAIAALEAGGGIASHSLALLSDAAHVFMDAVALGITVFAARQARRPATDHRSYGYARVEILAALGNAVLLFGLTAGIVVEAVHRFWTPAEPTGFVMSAVAGTGALANVALAVFLARGAHGDLNARAAFLHVVTDVAGALAVALGGLAVAFTHRAWIDPVLSLAVCALIVYGVARIVRSAADVLLESAPAHLTVPQVRSRIRALPGILDVHDLHVWSIGSGSHVLSAHVVLPDGRISEASNVLREIDRTMREEFAISHVTVQFECEACGDPGGGISPVVCSQVDAGK